MVDRARIVRFLRPRSVAFIGGSLAPEALRICREAGFTGPIHAVHPTRSDLAGVPALRSVAALPAPPDAAFVAAPAEATVEIVRELAAIGAGGAVCYAAGFSETGNHELEEALVAAAGAMPLLGPNCYGLINRVDRVSLWPVPYPGAPPDRGVAMVLQSGNLGINLTMSQRSLPIAFLVSVGNQAQVDVAQVVDALCDQSEVTGIGIYLEGLRDVALFADAADRARERGVPICVVKAGVSELGGRLAATHTSSLAGSDELYDALFDRLGVARAPSIPAMLESLKATSILGPLRGRRTCIFTCSGGESALAADAAAASGLELPQPSPAVAHALTAALPRFASVTNPLDYNTSLWGLEEPLHRVFTTALDDPYDAVALVIDYPHPALAVDGHPDRVTVDVDNAIRALRRAAAEKGVPAAVITTLPESFPALARERAIAEGVAPLQGLTDALAGIGAGALLGERMRAPRLPLARAGAEPEATLRDEWESKRVLSEAGLRVPDGRLVVPREAAAAAAEIGFPVAVKLCSAAIPHKAAAGAMRLGLRSTDEVADAVTAMLAAVGDVPLAGVLVERMVEGTVAELLVGVKRDPSFGPVLVVGAGGGLVEVLRDARPVLLPASRAEIEEALRSLRVWPLVAARGDVAAVIDATVAIATLVHDQRDRIAGLDVNPLLVLPAGEGVVVADALLVW
jgi:acetyl-CoA synthetase